ncbi:OLC1v1005121C1 [Oldenlandia corymbosa var. corymbosa]|uniref:OLC1v1005121C1 n=1 Tax=Oldenlandia corymbosa var. corymbosa TaxID=529605 RepID=A0AAV1DGL9_OLDCO|nr:OLC1v1005121C1 [Oldenlandia corymbosa var. corymbosa]
MEGGELVSENRAGSPETLPLTPRTMKDVKALVTLYSNYLWNRLISFLPNPNTNFLGKVTNLYHATARNGKRRRRTISLPLPLPPASSSDSFSRFSSKASKIFEVLEDMMENVILNLHCIQKNLEFWQSRAEGTNAQKAYFMICERGPQAFIDGVIQFIRDSLAEGSGKQQLICSASSYMSERIIVLSNLRYHLADFLAQVYMEVDKVGDDLAKETEKSVPSLLVIINNLFLNLEASIGHFHANRQTGSSIDGSYSFPLVFDKLPEVNQEGSQWTECETRDAINLIYQNLQKLDTYISSLVAKHQKPRKVTLYWMHYTCGAVGISVCSLWLLSHSRVMGSADIDNWIREAKDSTVGFWKDHVEQPLLSIRDELFETFRKRQKGVMEREEVQLTADSLHRMLLAFSEQTKGQKIPQNASDQEMLEIVMGRYEKELMHPIQNLLGGELVRALLIQVQKLKLDIETAMLELDQILRANEINFAILAALPAFGLSLILLMLVRAWFKQDTRAEGRGRVARIQRRLLVVEIERGLMQYQICKDKGLEKDADSMFGLLLYGLDRLCCAVEKHAKATGEWMSLRRDIYDLAKPGLETQHKLVITSRLERLYDCLLPSPKRQ